MKKKVLHLSHTDIRFDPRIVKELTVLATANKYELKAVGIENDEGIAIGPVDDRVALITLQLWSRALKLFPRFIRLAIGGPILAAIEFTCRMAAIGVSYRPTVVHCHDTYALPAGLIVKWLTGARVIYDAHELESDKNGQGWLNRSVTLRLERFAWRHIDLLISVSPSIIRWYQQHLGDKPAVLVLNAPDSPLVVADGSTPRGRYFNERFNIPEDSLIFIYVGLLMPGRGIEQCLKAFSGPDGTAHLVFLGYGALADEIKTVAATHPRIHHHPPVPHQEVVDVIKNADVGLCLIEKVSLSDYYCLPNKLFEYSFANLAVLASDFPDIRDCVQRYELGRVCDGTAEAIGTAVADFENRSFRRRAASLQDLTWETQSRRVLEAYEELTRTHALAH